MGDVVEYPVFDVPVIGGGLLIAIVAITHVFIAHFAVGGGVYLAVTHGIALRRDDALLFRYLRDHSRFLVVFAFVAGAVTGVGIWITISLVSPVATSRLIHNFVWAWAVEWCFFAVEIVAGYVYYYGLKRLRGMEAQAGASDAPGCGDPATTAAIQTERRRLHRVAWVYAVSAWMSLFVINGILTFMLTPSEWARMLHADVFDPNFGFWLGIFNETFWPSLLLRTISALALAAIFVAVIVNARAAYTRDERHRIISLGAYYMLPLVLMAPLAAWYFAELPPDVRTLAFGGAVAMTLFMAFGVVASIMIGAYAYFGLIRYKRYINLETSLLLLAIAFVATGSMEFVREGIRKPYLIHGVLYSNGIPADPDYRRRLCDDGLLTHMPFVRAPSQTIADVRALPLRQAGELVFRAQCASCHVPGGFNGLEPLVRDKSREWLLRTTRELHRVRHYMPPFVGDEFELAAIVEYQLRLAEGVD